ncbi:hypothetical protein KAS31_02915 [Candidatus Parcubacteria bacterium]|nr:hypothetical protein [Candidatus Parcubacteria bacterium]
MIDTIEAFLSLLIATLLTAIIMIAGTSLVPAMMASMPPIGFLAIFMVIWGLATIFFDKLLNE